MRRKQDVFLDMAKYKLAYAENVRQRAHLLLSEKTISEEEYDGLVLKEQLAKFEVELAEIDAKDLFARS